LKETRHIDGLYRHEALVKPDKVDLTSQDPGAEAARAKTEEAREVYLEGLFNSYFPAKPAGLSRGALADKPVLIERVEPKFSSFVVWPPSSSSSAKEVKLPVIAAPAYIREEKLAKREAILKVMREFDSEFDKFSDAFK
jgi:hypothetical protein